MNFGPNAPIEEIDMIARYGTAAVIGALVIYLCVVGVVSIREKWNS